MDEDPSTSKQSADDNKDDTPSPEELEKIQNEVKQHVEMQQKNEEEEARQRLEARNQLNMAVTEMGLNVDDEYLSPETMNALKTIEPVQVKKETTKKSKEPLTIQHPEVIFNDADPVPESTQEVQIEEPETKKIDS